MSKVLMIAAGPRKNGNSSMLLDEFAQGAVDGGLTDIEKVYFSDMKINYCLGCGACMKTKTCVQKDDMADLLEKMLQADTIVLGSPVYFYCVCGQMKTVIDRCCPKYEELSDKTFYLMMSAADEEQDGAFDETKEAFNGFLRCLEGAHIGGTVCAEGVFEKGAVRDTPAFRKAYDLGLRCAELALK